MAELNVQAAQDVTVTPGARGAEGVGEKFKQVLIFMNVSTPDLVEPARAALSSLESALVHFINGQKQAGAHYNNWRVRALVHGYQVLGQSELDSAIYGYDPPDQPSDGLTSAMDIDPSLPYLPADPDALFHFVRTRLAEPLPDAHGKSPSRVLLIVWGHGQGVGSALAASREVLQARGVTPLPPEIERPALLNTGVRFDESVADGLHKVLQAANGATKMFDLVILDSCLMATAELAFEFREITRFLIASYGFVQKPGLSVGNAVVEFLRIERDDPATSPQERGVAVVDAAKSIVGLVGDRRSGASALTLFRLEESKSWQTKADQAPCGELATLLSDLTEQVRASVAAASNSRRPLLAPALRTVNFDLIERHPWLRLFAVFTQLLGWASADLVERARIITAFERTLFHHSRQLLDLRDLARQVLQYSRVPLLQTVALELWRELEERDYGFVVRWRAVIDSEEKKRRYGGVTVYCPWFDASGSNEFDACVELDFYRNLDLARFTGWSDFVLGSMYDATAGARMRARELALCREERARASWPGAWGPCACARDGHVYAGRPVGALTGGDKPSGPLSGGDKPSGPLSDKPSGALSKPNAALTTLLA